MQYFFLDDNGNQKGPVDKDQLIANGVKSTTMVWRAGMAGWMPASNVEDLKGLFNSPPPVNPPPTNASAMNTPLPSMVTLEGPASAGDRFLARLIDGFAVSLISIIIPFIGGIAGLVYLFTMDALPFLNGQSIGKKVMKIRVVDAATERPITEDYSKSALRYVSLIIPFFNIIDAFMVLSDDGRRFGDKWADTKVMKEMN